jgi:Ca2+-binding RTX toxin-like protein
VKGSDKNLVDLINADPLLGNFNNFNNIENAISKSSNGFKTGPTGGFSATSDKAWASTIQDGTSTSDAAVIWNGSNGPQGGNDALYGGSNHDLLQGQAGNDLIEGRAGNDTLEGGGGHDYLIGSSQGQTTLVGGPDNDTLFGSYGTDNLTGGTGEDTFILRPSFGLDVIQDFNPAEDKIWVWVNSLDTVGATNPGTVTYDQSSGSLFYNNGTGAQILGILETKPLSSDLSLGTDLATNNIFLT